MPAKPYESVESLLQRFVSFDTVNAIITGRPFPERPMLEYVESLAQAMGLGIRRLAVPEGGENLVLTHRISPTAPWLMFISHMDTVSTAGMTIAPHAGKIEGGRMWSRGACDTKGTGAAMLEALRLYREDAATQQHNIALVFTVDEEYGMTGVRSLIAQRSTLGVAPRGVIVGEPTMLRPFVATNGAVRLKLTTRGIAAHSADPTKGRSAISDMVHVVDAIESHYIPKLSATHHLTGKAQSSINMIQGGVQINIIPASCEVRIDRRVVPGEKENAQTVMEAIRRVLAPVVAARPGLVFEQEVLFAGPAQDDRVSAPFLPFVQSALASMNLPTQPHGAPYSTEAGDLSEAGIPAIVIGPGDIAQAHTKDEWLDLDQLHRGVEMYLALMRGKA